MKNESKTGLTSGAKLTIPGCDCRGTFRGYDVYRCYNKIAPQGYPNIVFLIGNWMYMNGEIVGYVNGDGEVTKWHPNVVENKKVVEETGNAVARSADADVSADEVIAASWKRSIEDLVGERFSVEYKYSE